jgi:hypothetical protein
VIERGQQLALGQVAGGAEDDDDARIGVTLRLAGFMASGLILTCVVDIFARTSAFFRALDCFESWLRTQMTTLLSSSVPTLMLLVFLTACPPKALRMDRDHAVGEVVLFARAQAANQRLGDDRAPRH